ncbi:MAG: hypothetical protein H7Z41_00895 [Cytophagales bacterium]|nr:hypothetical protein [Armatimonadota bacterium]
MTALLVFCATLGSVSAPQNLSRLIEEEGPGCVVALKHSSSPLSLAEQRLPLRKRSSQYQAQHRHPWMRRVAQSPQLALVPDVTRFASRLLPRDRSRLPIDLPARLCPPDTAHRSPRAPPPSFLA